MSNKIIMPEDNVVSFADKIKVIEGGKGGGNWLAPLNNGSEFLCRWKRVQPLSNEGFILMQFKVASRIVEEDRLLAVLLVTDVNQEQSQFVDPIRFCNLFDLVAILNKGVSNE